MQGTNTYIHTKYMWYTEKFVPFFSFFAVNILLYHLLPYKATEGIYTLRYLPPSTQNRHHKFQCSSALPENKSRFLLCSLLTAPYLTATLPYNKPTRCINFSEFIFGRKPYMFRTVSLSIMLTACDQEQMLLLTSCQQTCMTHTIAVCTVKNS
jgi:hypothetical protein